MIRLNGMLTRGMGQIAGIIVYRLNGHYVTLEVAMRGTILIAVAVVVLLAGCTGMQVRRTSISDSSGSFTPEAIDPLLEPVVEVGPQVTGRGSGTEFLWIFGFGDSAKVDGFTWGNPVQELPVIGGLIGVRGKDVLGYAVYDACVRGKADFLVAPRYVITEDNYIFWKNYTVTVTGHAGRYTAFEPIKYETRRQWAIQDATKRIAIGGSGVQQPVNVHVEAQ